MDDLYYEINKHLLEDEKPSIYMEKILSKGLLKSYPFFMIGDLTSVPQNLKHHPEGSVWNHLMMVIDEGAKYRKHSKDKKAFMWSLLLHDIGKTPTTKLRKGRWTSYDHEKVGSEMAEKFLNFLGQEENFINTVKNQVRYHMECIFVVNNLPFGDMDAMVANTSLDEMILISICDRLGRGNMDKEKVKETLESVERFASIVKSNCNFH